MASRPQRSPSSESTGFSPWATIGRPSSERASHIRPALVLAERESRTMLDAARGQDVTSGGRFVAIPACIQVWDRPWVDENDPGAPARERPAEVDDP